MTETTKTDSSNILAAGLSAPELQKIVGAMLFAAKKPLSLREICRVLNQVAAERQFDEEVEPITDSALKKIMDKLNSDLAQTNTGVVLDLAPGEGPAAGGYRLRTDPSAGPWLRCMLDLGKPTRLSRPALETLAITAYRQPVSRAEIEGVRGVSVDAILRSLQEMQLIKIVGRSELPGRPLLYGTTELFLEHFGLKNVKELPGIEQLAYREQVCSQLSSDNLPAADRFESQE